MYPLQKAILRTLHFISSKFQKQTVHRAALSGTSKSGSAHFPAALSWALRAFKARLLGLCFLSKHKCKTNSSEMKWVPAARFACFFGSVTQYWLLSNFGGFFKDPHYSLPDGLMKTQPCTAHNILHLCFLKHQYWGFFQLFLVKEFHSQVWK